MRSGGAIGVDRPCRPKMRNVDLSDSGENRLEDEQALVSVVLVDRGDEAETVALADEIRMLGAGEVQVKDVHIFVLEGWPGRRFGTLVPGGDEDVVSSVVVAVIGHGCNRAIELDGPAAVFGGEGCDRLIAV